MECYNEECKSDGIIVGEREHNLYFEVEEGLTIEVSF